MTATLRTEDLFRITATAADPVAAEVAGVVADLLGLSPRQVDDRLSDFPSVLASDLPGDAARRLGTMLGLLGIRVRLEQLADRPEPGDPAVDLALHPAEGTDRDTLADRLMPVLRGLPGVPTRSDLRARLDLPGGLVLRGVPLSACRDLRGTLGRDSGVWITQSDARTAVFDLFAPRPLRAGGLTGALGLAPCPFSGAAVAGMNLATARRVLRAAGPGAVLVDRAFQRFDLVLTAAPQLAPAERADFLATRPATAALSPRDRLCLPLRIDRDLPRRTAEQFVADYAAMGLEVVARLRGRLPGAGQEIR